MLKKIVLVAPNNALPQSELDHIQALLQSKKITAIFVKDSDDIITHAPDCVISLSPEVPKLTHFPTYGLMQKPIDTYLELPRYVRNILTYDGFLTTCDKTKESLQDLMFGARKLDTEIAHFDFHATAANNKPSHYQHVFYFESDLTLSPFSKALKALQANLPGFKMGSDRWGLHREVIPLSNQAAVQTAYQQAGIGLCLSLTETENQRIDPQLLAIIASGAAAITPFSETLHSLFGDTLWYISPNLTTDELVQAIQKQVARIQATPQLAQEKAARALAIYQDKLSFDVVFPNLSALHIKTLRTKGFIPETDDVPQVTYLLHTDGTPTKLERVLTSLTKQQYAGVKIILIPTGELNLAEIHAKFPSLNIKSMACNSSSKAHSLAMQAVDTEWFGILQDTDELHPNHIRSLIKTLQYHHQLDWRGSVKLAYSGSILIHPEGATETEAEFLDTALSAKRQKRLINQFCFYRGYKMANHAWRMGNTWLAHRSLLDHEILIDAAIADDLYLGLQLAQRTSFAFSVEATLYHHEPAKKLFATRNKPVIDARRIALRNFSRNFQGDFGYDSVFNPMGFVPQPKQPQYADDFGVPSLKHRIQVANQTICAPDYLSSHHAYVPPLPEPTVVQMMVQPEAAPNNLSQVTVFNLALRILRKMKRIAVKIIRKSYSLSRQTLKGIKQSLVFNKKSAVGG